MNEMCIRDRPKAPQGPVDCGESGSTLRFLIPAFALASAPARLTGRGRLPQRPLGPYGAIFHGPGLPFAQDETGVSFQGPLAPGDYGLPGDVSSQFISGLLFALPLLPGDSHIRIQPPFESREMCIRDRPAPAPAPSGHPGRFSRPARAAPGPGPLFAQRPGSPGYCPGAGDRAAQRRASGPGGFGRLYDGQRRLCGGPVPHPGSGAAGLWAFYR